MGFADFVPDILTQVGVQNIPHVVVTPAQYRGTNASAPQVGYTCATSAFQAFGELFTDPARFAACLTGFAKPAPAGYKPPPVGLLPAVGDELVRSLFGAPGGSGGPGTGSSWLPWALVVGLGALFILKD